LLVHLVGGPEPNFEKWRVFVEQPTDAFSREQSSHFVLAILPGFAAAFAEGCFFSPDRGATLA
jgi:hypothetical protein